MGKMKSSVFSFLIAMFLAMSIASPFAASVVHAQVSPPASGSPLPSEGFTLPDDDTSKKFVIDPLFGPISGADIPSPLTDAFSVFNAILLFVGGVLLAYTLIAGTMSSAHDGEVLGKKWSAMWLPIRTSMGVAAVMPVVKGGWCVAQVIVLWLAMQGAQIANVVWKGFIGNGENVAVSATYTPPDMAPGVKRMFATMYLANVCVVASNMVKDDAGSALAKDYSLATYKVWDVTREGWVNGTDFRRSKYNVFKYGRIDEQSECGEIAYTVPVKNGTKEKPVPQIGGVEINTTKHFDISAIERSVEAARVNEFRAAQPVLMRLAQDQLGEKPDEKKVMETFNALSRQYVENLTKAAVEGSKTIDQQGFKDALVKDGWLFAGSYFMRLVNIQNTISESVASLPTALKGIDDPSSTLDPGLEVGLVDFFLSRHPRGVREKMTAQRKMVAGVLSDGGTGSVQVAEDETSWGSDYFVNKMVSYFTASGNDVFGDSGNLSENPIIMAANLGNNMITWGAAGLAGSAAVAVFSPKAGPFFAGLLATFSAPFMVTGATLAFYLPMMPYVLWIGAVVGWVILLIQAMVAAPLWAIIHLAPDGDGVVGRGGQGYMLVLSLVMKPVLMIIGLIFAFTVMRIVGSLVNASFSSAFAMANTGGSSGLNWLLRSITGCVLYTVMMMSLVKRIFDLIHKVPDTTLQWIGGGGPGVGETAQAMEQQSDHMSKAGMAAAAGGAIAAKDGISQGLQAARTKGIQDQQASIAKADRETQKEQNRRIGNIGDRAAVDNAKASVDGAETNEGKRFALENAIRASGQAQGRSSQDALAGARDRANVSDKEYKKASIKEQSRIDDAKRFASADAEGRSKMAEGFSDRLRNNESLESWQMSAIDANDFGKMKKGFEDEHGELSGSWDSGPGPQND